MNDKDFKKMDETMMKKMEPLRSREVSEGILKGFSASVERRISSRASVAAGDARRGTRLVWAPAAVMAAFALFIVFKTPVQTGLHLSSPSGQMELAQLVSGEEIQEEIALLSELGVLEEGEGEGLLSDEELLLAEEMELSQKTSNLSLIA